METPLRQLVDRSQRIGADPELVVHGGGNTSTKTTAVDHLGRERSVLLVKGSGSDMRVAEPADFAGLYLDEIVPLRERSVMTDEEMVAYLARCLIDPTSRRPSIETLLHAFIPATDVDHVHADAICSLTNTPEAEKLVEDALGSDIAFVPYIRPGFELSKRVGELSGAKAVVLAHHGLVTWGATGEESYELTRELVERAQAYVDGRRDGRRPARRPDLEDTERLVVSIRGRLSRTDRKILHVDPSQRASADREDVHALTAAGPATADHVLRIGSGVLVLDDPEQATAAIDGYEQRYREYFARCRRRLEADHDMHDPGPRALMVPGLGCIGVGRDKRTARVVSDVAHRSHAVAAAVIDAFGEAEPLSEQDLFDLDYWGLELYKLTLAPPPAELAGRVVVVTGAGSGIGRAIASMLANRGAHIIAADVNSASLSDTVASLPRDQAEAVEGDVAQPSVVDEIVRRAVLSFGGLDALVCNAGVAVTGPLNEATDDMWQRSLDVNATSHFRLTRRAWQVFEQQGIGGSIVYVASKNAFAPGAGFGPYSVAKAALVQLARIAAIEGGVIGVRANVVNPDAVFEGSKLWSEDLRHARARAHDVPVEELEDFYRKRSILGRTVTPEDVAEAVSFLVSDRSRSTTGCVLTVDGGVAAAFPR